MATVRTPLEAAALPYITNPNGLRRWGVAYAACLAGERDAPVIWGVDSHTHGQYFDGSQLVTANADCLLVSPAAVLRRLMARRTGVDPGEGFIFPNDSRVTSGGGITTGVYQGPSLLRNNRRFTSASHTLTLAVPGGGAADRVRLIQGNGSMGTDGAIPGTGGASNAQITYAKNGGGAQNLTAPTNTGLSLVDEITVADGDSIVVNGPSSGQNTFLGFELRKNTSQAAVPVHRVGQMGYTAANIGGGVHNGTLWNPNGTNTLTAPQVAAQIRAHYKWAEAGAKGGKGVVVIATGTNEQSKQASATGIDCGVTPSLFRTMLTTIVQQIAADGWCTLLVSPCPSGSELTALGAEPLTSYSAVARQVAMDNDHVAHIDVADIWGGGHDPITLQPVDPSTKAAAIAAAGVQLRDPNSSHPTKIGYVHGYARPVEKVLTSFPQGL